MRNFWLFAAAALIALGSEAREARADVITLTPSADTFISEHFALGGPTSTHGGDALLFSIQGTGNFTAFPLLRFDLTRVAGTTVTGPATLQLFTSTDFPQSAARTESLHPVLIGWNPSTATFNNFSPLGPGVHFGSDVGAALDTRSFVLDGADPARTLTWTIPASVIQQWIDNPASNDGLLLNNQITTNQFDVQFNSAENTNPPLLTFRIAEQLAVTEPSGWLVFGGVAGVIVCGRRSGRRDL